MPSPRVAGINFDVIVKECYYKQVLALANGKIFTLDFHKKTKKYGDTRIILSIQSALIIRESAGAT